MKLQVLNKCLPENNCLGVRFIFPPIVFLIESASGKIVSPTQLTDNSKTVVPHYSTIVWVIDNEKPAIIEFNQQVLAIIQGYAKRYSNIADVEILISRIDAGELRITIGRNSNLGNIDMQTIKIKTMFDCLHEKYLEKTGYIMNDFKI